jgi:hypothetical protein
MTVSRFGPTVYGPYLQVIQNLQSFTVFTDKATVFTGDTEFYIVYRYTVFTEAIPCLQSFTVFTDKATTHT